MDDNLKQQLLFEANRKSTGAAYLLWFFLGGFGAHRFYLGRVGTGVAQLLLFVLGWIPLFAGWIVLGIWWLIDAFLIPDLIRVENLKTIQMIESGRSYRDPAFR
jgi:TM2 domain-containing membrane protein YozV